MPLRIDPPHLLDKVVQVPEHVEAAISERWLVTGRSGSRRQMILLPP
jgi:hypothetical protein